MGARRRPVRHDPHLERVQHDPDTRVGQDRREILRREEDVVLRVGPARPGQPFRREFVFHRFLTDLVDVAFRGVGDRRRHDGADVLGRGRTGRVDLFQLDREAEPLELLGFIERTLVSKRCDEVVFLCCVS